MRVLTGLGDIWYRTPRFQSPNSFRRHSSPTQGFSRTCSCFAACFEQNHPAESTERHEQRRVSHPAMFIFRYVQPEIIVISRTHRRALSKSQLYNREYILPCPAGKCARRLQGAVDERCAEAVYGISVITLSLALGTFRVMQTTAPPSRILQSVYDSWDALPSSGFAWPSCPFPSSCLFPSLPKLPIQNISGERDGLHTAHLQLNGPAPVRNPLPLLTCSLLGTVHLLLVASCLSLSAACLEVQLSA